MRTRIALCVAAGVLAAAITGLRADSSQQLADIRVAGLLNRAAQSLDVLKIDEAQKDIDEAMAIAEKLGDRVGLAMTYRSRGRLLHSKGNTTDSIPWYEKAVSAFEALGNQLGIADALLGLMAALEEHGDRARILKESPRALAVIDALANDRYRARLLRILVSVTPSAETRTKYTQEILAAGKRLSDDSLIGDAFVLLANAELQAGNLAAAQTAYEQGIVALEKAGHIEPIATAYLSFGRVFRAHGDYEGALQRYQKAIDLLAPTKERFTVVEAINAKAIALGLLGRTKEALASYERGLALAREGSNQRLIDFMEGNLAGGLMGAQEYARAIPALEAVIAKKPEPFILAYRQNSLAVAYTHVGRASEAMPLIDEAVKFAREGKILDVLPGRLDSRTWILKTLGRFDEALRDAREVIDIYEQMRGRLIPSDFLKRGFADRVQSEYGAIVDLLSLAGRASESLEFAEQGRARAFLDLLAARELTSAQLTTRGAPANPASPEAGLASESMGKPLRGQEIQQLAGRLKSAIVTYWVFDDATLAWIIRPDGRPTHVRIPITRDKLNALVAATTAPLRESSGPATMRGASVEADRAPQATAADLAALPMRGLGLLALSRDTKAAWRELYKTLIEPVRAQLPERGGRITIVPHGPLFQLSFAALQNSAGRYLIEDYELHYAPAISALEFTGRRQQAVAANTKGPWAIVGNPATLPSVGDRPLPPLPGAAREITAIAALAPNGSAIRLDGAAADEAALARTLETRSPSLLHFATHGFVFDDPKTPPFLALNRKGTIEANDGRLTLDEVYGLRLQTDLVVLSACRTGSGKISSDGILGLTRGFFYAGSPSVMATYWDVVDGATANLMSGFYRSYTKTRAKGASLRAAQLALLADLRAGKVVVTAGGRKVVLPEHPLLWAAFFLSGEP